MQIVNRAANCAVALETTLLVHGVPKASARPLADELNTIIESEGASPALVGVVHGKPTVGMTPTELDALLSADTVAKANTANLGVLMSRGQHAATTVSATMELAAAAGVRVFATGGLGGVHPGLSERLDISSDLAAFTRFPVAVVTSGVKSILDVESTREALETLGVPVVGYKTDRFPAFYLRNSDADVDARFDDVDELASFVSAELARTGRGIVIANPIPEEGEIDPHDWANWLAQAERSADEQGAAGRRRTPALLAALHALSGSKTLESNLALVRCNARLAGALAARLQSQ